MLTSKILLSNVEAYGYGDSDGSVVTKKHVPVRHSNRNLHTQPAKGRRQNHVTDALRRLPTSEGRVPRDAREADITITREKKRGRSQRLELTCQTQPMGTRPYRRIIGSGAST